MKIIYRVILSFLFLVPSVAFSEIFTFNKSAIYSSSLSVFAEDYDLYTDSFYWTETEKSIVSSYDGIQDNYLSLGVASEYKNIYAALNYTEKLTGYGYWPHNMTDEEVTVFLGLKNGFSAKVRYFDYSYTHGRGMVQPALTLAKKFDISSTESSLNTSFEFGWKSVYRHGLKSTYLQPNFMLSVDYGKNRNNGVGLSYYVMISRNTGDPSYYKNCPSYSENYPLFHKISAWVGKTFPVGENLDVGIRPQGFIALNSWDYALAPEWSDKFGEYIDLYQVLPVRGEMECYGILPLAFKYSVFDGKLDLCASLMIGIYFASFNHKDSKHYDGTYGLGGRNPMGTVPLSGFGLGAKYNINPQASLSIGAKCIRIPQIDGFDDGNYEESDLSMKNYVSSPIYISFSFRK